MKLLLDTHTLLWAAGEDDVAFYSSLTPQQRLDMVLELSASPEEEKENASREDVGGFIELLNSNSVDDLVVQSAYAMGIC